MRSPSMGPALPPMAMTPPRMPSVSPTRMPPAQADTALGAIHIMRRDAGLPPTGFEVGLPFAEPVTQAAVDAVQELGVHDLVVIAPWLPSPWDPSRGSSPARTWRSWRLRRGRWSVTRRRCCAGALAEISRLIKTIAFLKRKPG